MVNYTLKSLADMIKKCCTSVDSDSLNDLYPFTLDVDKLRNVLKSKGTDLHVIALNRTLESRPVQLEDVQFITEYVHEDRMYNTIFDGKTHIVQLMLFSSENEGGHIDFLVDGNEGEDPIILNDKELFNKCNIDVDEEFVKHICRDIPCYRIIITRSFIKGFMDKHDGPTDKFEYTVNIRSNFQMVSFQRFCKEQRLKEKSDNKDSE